MIKREYMHGNTYQFWKLECSVCHKDMSLLIWDYDLPTTCSCGGRSIHAYTKLPVVPAKRHNDTSDIVPDIVPIKSWHRFTEAEILADMGMSDAEEANEEANAEM